MAAPVPPNPNKRRVPFQPENKSKALLPIRCPLPDHDPRSGLPLLFGLGGNKDRELEAKILKEMKLSDIDEVVEEASNVDQPASARMHGPIKRSQSHGHGHKRVGASSRADVGDGSLMTAMAGRLRNAEEGAKAMREEIRKKDQTISQLRLELAKAVKGEKADKIERTESAGDVGVPGRDADAQLLKEHNTKLREMLRKSDAECRRAEKENAQMKTFLRDYGMLWVGEESKGTSPSSSPELEPAKPKGKDLLMQGMWMPGEASPSIDLNSQSGLESLDTAFDPAQIIGKVKALNVIAGEGQKEVVSGADGIRRLREKCQVGYVFYKNGIFARGGPLRSYAVRESKVLVRDLMDGYFPWELKDEYPEGVPLRVEMRLDEVYGQESKPVFSAFRGAGNALGKEEGGASAGGPTQGGSEAARKEVWAPMAGISKGQTLFRQLPANVVRNGNVIPIRSEIKELVCGKGGGGDGVVHVEQASQDVARPHSDEDDDGAPIAVLRVKTPGGDRVMELKMGYTTTIGDLHARLRENLQTKLTYRIRSSFPSREYTDHKQTLEDAGLTPNALLFITEA